MFKRFSLNLVSYGYGQLVTLAVQLLLVPFFLRFWGTEGYADWLVLTGIPTMLTLLDLGVAQAMANAATMQAAAGERTKATISLQTALAFTICLCSFIVLLATTVGARLEWSDLLRLGIISNRDASIIVICMSAYLCAGLMGGPLDAWFRTIDRTAAGAFLLANRRMLDVLVSISALCLGASPLILAISLFTGQVLATTVLYVVAIRWSPWPIFGLRLASYRELRLTLKPAVAYMGFPVAQVVTLQGGLQLLNLAAAPAMVVAFTMVRTLMRLIMQVGVVANNALKPELSRLAGQDKHVEAMGFARKSARWVFLGSLLLYVALTLSGPSIVHLWSHGKVAATPSTMALVGMHTVAATAWWVSGALLIATNRHTQIAAVYAATSLLALLIWATGLRLFPPIPAASMLLLAPELAAVVATHLMLRKKVVRHV